MNRKIDEPLLSAHCTWSHFLLLFGYAPCVQHKYSARGQATSDYPQTATPFLTNWHSNAKIGRAKLHAVKLLCYVEHSAIVGRIRTLVSFDEADNYIIN